MSLVLPPRLNASLLHPRYWFTWLGTGLLWLVIQLPYPLLMAMGRTLGHLAQLLLKRRVSASPPQYRAGLSPPERG